MITGLTIKERTAQPYVGIRTQVPMQAMATVADRIGDVFGWLQQRGIPPAGAPFFRYHVINMAAKLDVAAGVPVATAVAGDDHVQADVLPAGRYASLLYTGDYAGLMGANAALLAWVGDQGLVLDRWDTAQGHAFGGRFETYFTDPSVEPDPGKWETEVAIRLAD